MGPVVDIEIPKALPTNEIVVSKKTEPKKLKTYFTKFPDNQQEPFYV
jgi:hypothetical protein